jgi:hypothetical protein
LSTLASPVTTGTLCADTKDAHSVRTHPRTVEAVVRIAHAFRNEFTFSRSVSKLDADPVMETQAAMGRFLESAELHLLV